MSATAAPLVLESLGGAAAPPDLAGDLRRLLRVPAEGLGQIWQVLGPCLGDKLSDETEKLLDVYATAYALSSDDLGRAVKACRFLILSAARLDVAKERLAADLSLLCPDAPIIGAVLLAGYDAARKAIRQNLAIAAVMAHGKLLHAAEWRIDTIETSHQGGSIRVPITLVTLHYRDGQESSRITLQVLPDMMAELKTMCDRVLP